MADDLIRDDSDYYAVTGEHPIIRAGNDPQLDAFVAWCQVTGRDWTATTFNTEYDYVAMLLTESDGDA